MNNIVLCVQNLGVPDDPRVWLEACSLAAHGHDVTVVAPRTNGAPSRQRIDGVDVVRYRPIGGHGVAGQILEVASGFVGTTLAVARRRRAGPIDVLHVANPPDTLFPLAWWLRRSGTLFVYDQHDAAPELAVAKLGRHAVLDRLLGRLELASYRAADLVIASNNAIRTRVIARGIAPERVVTVRLGPHAAMPPAPPPMIPTVAYAGVMGTQDTVELLVDAFAAVVRRRPASARLVLIGHGDAIPALRRRVVDLGISDAVTWTGWVTRAEVHEHLRSATVAVSPDVDDPYTRLCTMIKVSEYLAAGVPAVVADLPENRATAGDAAAYFRAGDVADLARHLEDVLFDPARRQELAEAAGHRAPALRWEHSAARLTAAYDHLLGGAPAVEGDQHVDDMIVARGS